VSEEPSVFRPGAVSYLRIPAPDAARLAGFYREAFGWIIRGDPGKPAFTDGSGHVIGHFRPDLPVGGDAGVRPYIYVERIDESLGQITAHGGQVTVPPYAEGDLWVALFRDPAGNTIGVWQQGARS
jgi:predicted enzyme related to lactoylglutathione lyase